MYQRGQNQMPEHPDTEPKVRCLEAFRHTHLKIGKTQVNRYYAIEKKYPVQLVLRMFEINDSA